VHGARDAREVESGIVELLVDHRPRPWHETRGGRLGVGRVAPQRGNGERIEQRAAGRAGRGDGLGDERGELRRGRQGGRQRGERRQSGLESDLDPGVPGATRVVEGERLAVAGQEQRGPTGPQLRTRGAVDLDPDAALVDDHELHVALVARAQAAAGRVDDLAHAQPINLGQHTAHSGHWRRAGRAIACSSWTSPSSSTDATGRTGT
jgi:hypothetical protein